MTIEPLRSATTIERVEETSLALPSDNTLRSGQQRVLDQVHTIKRSRSKKSGSLSPTSPQKISEFRSFKFVPTTLNGSIYSRSNSAGTSSGHMKMTSHSIQTRSLSTKSLGRRQVSHASQIEQRFLPISPTAMEVPVLKQSNSDPELDVGAKVMQQAKSRTLRSMSTRVGQPSFQTITNGSTHYYQTHVPNQAPLANQTQLAGQTHILRPPSNHSSREAKTSFKTKEAVIAFNDVGSIPDITMKEAVEYLSSTDQAYQLRGASYIQHTTFKEDMAKQEVFQLNGIPLLVAHLRSPNSQIQQTAAAALRNLVFRHAANKQEVQQCGGIGEALALLRDTESTETQKQLSGLLWNLSSADELKPELINSALPVLTESIVIPFTCWSDSSAMNNVDSEVFYNATGCLRNLSCAKEAERKAMRDCRGLIDSLISYIQSCVSEDNPDDKSVENCTCILHNLTYQVEVEAPEHFSKITALSQPPSRSTATKEASPVSCFSPKSSKINRENVFNYPLVEESDPKGTEWLFHSKTLQTYLALMGNSMKDPTLEAYVKALTPRFGEPAR
ncbi:hypothetical protein JZ751_021276 [Albula glossodonta]|uniref:Plakophilin 1 n=1 Tax=Albula glossodonta TaxID=121402 RepID=A0A8T2MRI2_9TELE|nr:hypothetical protein JZ751_021276 [Albula glossodonta]